MIRELGYFAGISERIYGDSFDVTKVNSLNNALDKIPNKGNTSDYNLMVVFNWLYALAALVAVGYIVYAAIMYATSDGDANRIKKATKTITYSIIGLVIVVLAWAITTFVIKSIN